MNTKVQAKIITSKELPRMRRQLPASWKKAAGLLRYKRKALEQHMKRVRAQWGD